MSPRPDVSEERREQIIQAAIQVFSRQGLDKARMDDIVEESGLSKGTLYWYFESKDDIIISILESLFEREFGDLEQMFQDGGTVSQRLMKFTDSAMADFQRMLTLLPLTYEFYALAFRQDSVRQALTNYFQTYVQSLDPLVQEGIDSGEFRQVRARDVTLAIGAIIEGSILLWVYDPEMVDLQYHPQTALKLLLQGVQAR